MALGLWEEGQYITEEMAQNLKLYKYAGGDSGLIYVYFYNPIAKRLVEYLPKTLAPNLITLTGFLFTVIPFLYLFTTYGWNFTTPIGSGFCYTNAACYLTYRMLDEMDGKQARRTAKS